MEGAALSLDADDVPILDMLVDRVSSPEIADALGLAPAELRVRIDTMLNRLKVPVRAG